MLIIQKHIKESCYVHKEKSHFYQLSLLERASSRQRSEIGYVNAKDQITDIFTKALPKDAHEYLRSKLGVIPLNTT